MGKKRLITSGVLASGPGRNQWNQHTRVLQNELYVTKRNAEALSGYSSSHPRNGDPNPDISLPNGPDIQLNTSAITRYTNEEGWDSHTWNLTQDTWIKGGHQSCLLVESGDGWSGNYNCESHYIVVDKLLNAILNNGYAGTFLWHYGNPDRISNTRLDKNVFTEKNILDINHQHNNNGMPLSSSLNLTNANPRPGSIIVKRFSRRHNDLLIPKL